MSATVDLTNVAVATVSGVFSILGVIVPIWISSKMRDKAAAAVLTQAIENSLGTLQVATEGTITAARPTIELPGVPPALAPGVQYVLDQAGPEAERLGITPLAIAQKIEAKIGLANIATNLAVTANPTPVVAMPLGPVPANLPASA